MTILEQMMLAKLLLELLSAGPVVITDFEKAVSDLKAAPGGAAKAAVAAQSVSTIATHLGAALTAAE